MKRYSVIFVDPADQEGCLAHVDASGHRDALDACYAAVDEEGGIWEGNNFTIWPVPVN